MQEKYVQFASLDEPPLLWRDTRRDVGRFAYERFLLQVVLAFTSEIVCTLAGGFLHPQTGVAA